MAGTLSIVATPIGNLEDITLRALRVLREADVIVSEDTRVTRKLLRRYDIRKPMLPYHQHSGARTVRQILALLSAGKSLALVTCAGTPGVSDPGPRLVASVLDRFGDDARITAIPGPSALTALASLSSVPMDEFHFFGYPPHKKGRRGYFEDVAANVYPGILFESPHRIRRTLGDLERSVGADRRVVIGRELTKAFETILRGTVGEVRRVIEGEKPRGEYVILVEPPSRRRHAAPAPNAR